MKKIIITRGHHVFEKSAIYLARRVAACLRDAYDVTECRIPSELTFLSAGIDDYAMEFIRDLEEKNPDSLVFSFHNSKVERYTKPVESWQFSEFGEEDVVVIETQYFQHYDIDLDCLLNGYTIEIPAVYVPIRKETIQRLPHPEFISPQACLLSSHAKQHRYEVDMAKTRQAGMMSNRVVEMIAEGIQDLVEQHAFSA